MCRAVVARCQSALVVAFVVFVVAQTAVLPVSGQSTVPVEGQSPAEPVGAHGVDSWTDSDERIGVSAQQSTPSNNTTAIQHRNPETVSESGNLSAVERHLSRQLSQRLGDSAVELEQGEYDRAQSLLGSEYDDTLEQFVDVADETGNGETAETLQEATRQQRSFANQTQAYHDTRAEYEQAKRAGDQRRARELARQLERRSENVTQRGTALTRTYDTIENSTGANLTEAETATENATRTVERQQAEIREAEFTETRLQLTADRRNISFVDPVTLEGRLETDNGTPIANRTIALQVGEDRRRVETNASGQFSLTYRPRTVPLSTTSLAVAYLPAETSPYLGSNARVPITISRQVSAAIQLDHHPDTVAYDERVVVAGTVAAADIPVRDVPVRVVLGGTHLGTVQTDSEGSFQLDAHLPARIAAGDRSVSVTLAQTERAVTATPTNGSVTVAPTATTVSIDADPAGSEQVVVTGRLRTADGTGVGNQPVAIETSGTTQAVVETNATGWFRASVPASGDPGTTVVVTASFDKPGTNLEATTARTRIVLPSGSGTTSSALIPAWIRWGAVLLGVVGLGGGAWYLLRRRRSLVAPEASTETLPTATSGVAAESSRSRSLLEAADAAVTEDPNAAVRLAYGSLRATLGDTLSVATTGTHWEFYTACLDAGLETDETFRTVIEEYERAAYSPDGVDQETAEHILETVRHILGD